MLISLLFTLIIAISLSISLFWAFKWIPLKIKESKSIHLSDYDKNGKDEWFHLIISWTLIAVTLYVVLTSVPYFKENQGCYDTAKIMGWVAVNKVSYNRKTWMCNFVRPNWSTLEFSDKSEIK
jgi:hypothetical protein